MKQLKVTIWVLTAFLLGGCVNNTKSEEKAMMDMANTATQTTVYASETTIVSNELLQSILLSRQEILSYGNINQVQILSTDIRNELNAVIMTFCNAEGQTFAASAVIKNDQVLTMQVEEVGENSFFDYKITGTDEEQGDYILYSGIVRDSKVTNIDFIYGNNTVVNTKLSDEGGYCYLSLKKESNNQEIVKIQEKDIKGNIIYTASEATKMTAETTYIQQEDPIQSQAMNTISNYYELMYQAYLKKTVSEEMFMHCLDMNQVQNKNKITAMKKLNMNWDYFQTIYSSYNPVASPVSLHLEDIIKKENDSYEVIVQIIGGKLPADYSPEDYLVGMGSNMEQQEQIPPFVSLGQNIFQLRYQGDQLLIEKHTYDGQKNFEGLTTVEVIFDPVAYQQLLEQKRWGQK